MTSKPDDASEPGNGPTTYNLLFVCSGNTCRSPLAAAITGARLRERGWSQVSVRSAGTAATYGAPASVHAVTVASEHGLDLSEHVSNPLEPAVLDWADLVLVMTLSQLDLVASLGGTDKVALVTDFIDGPGAGQPVRDPFGSDLESYRQTFAELERASAGLLAKLEPILSP